MCWRGDAAIRGSCVRIEAVSAPNGKNVEEVVAPVGKQQDVGYMRAVLPLFRVVNVAHMLKPAGWKSNVARPVRSSIRST